MSARYETICHFADVPFIVGAALQPRNLKGIPDVLPMTLEVDLETGLIRQAPSRIVSEHLETAYKSGSLLGTAMDDTALGRAYAEDFLCFAKSVVDLRNRSVLEIGAGRGYFVRLLLETGARAIGMEPGKANARFWEQKGVNVINEFFPNSLGDANFDIIAGFAVLEHIEHVDAFLDSVSKHLVDEGVAIFAVPDCGPYVVDGDPGMLLHEHWSYFTLETLLNVFVRAGFCVRSMIRSSHGGLIYIAATRPSGRGTVDIEPDSAPARRFGQCCELLRAKIAARTAGLRDANRSLGIYVPARALMWMDCTSNLRFFDDDPDLYGLYYPPFPFPIENRSDLLNHPVDELWIMSRSFGKRIASELEQKRLGGTAIVPIDDLLSGFARGE